MEQATKKHSKCTKHPSIPKQTRQTVEHQTYEVRLQLLPGVFKTKLTYKLENNSTQDQPRSEYRGGPPEPRNAKGNLR